jgi:chromosome segregation ATPase
VISADREAAEAQEQLNTHKAAFEQLEERSELLQEENRELEQRVARLREKVEGMEALKSSFLDELGSVQGAHTEAMSLPSASGKKPRPAGSSAPSNPGPDGS